MTVPFLAGPLLFVVGLSTIILILTWHGRTSAFLFPDLGIMNSTGILRGRIVQTVSPKVIVSDQAALVGVSQIGRRVLGLLLA